MEKDEWLKKCAARFEERAATTPGESMELAEIQLDALDGDLTEDPVDAADEEMSCWSE